MKEYTMLIRGGRDTYMTFTDYDEFVAEVRDRLSPRQISIGTLDLLTKFNMRRINDNGFEYYEGRNHYQNMETACYVSKEE